MAQIDQLVAATKKQALEPIKEVSEGLRNGMFATRPAIGDAYEYAADIAKSCGEAELYVLTAMHVLMNAIADELDRRMEG